jgi:hypothetical protein
MMVALLVMVTVFLCASLSMKDGMFSNAAPDSSPLNREQNEAFKQDVPNPLGSNAPPVVTPLDDFIKRAAKDYGITEEQARQELRKGAIIGYPEEKEKIDRLFGPEKKN